MDLKPPKMLTLPDVARELNISRATAHRWFREEPDVERFFAPGAKRATIRVPRAVFERFRRQASNPPWALPG